MISGSEDKQTSADVFNVNQFELPNPAGKAGGACTSTLLNVLSKHPDGSLTWLELLHKMRAVLKQKVCCIAHMNTYVLFCRGFLRRRRIPSSLLS